MTTHATRPSAPAPPPSHAAPRWSRRSMLRAAGGGTLGLAVVGSGAVGYRAYDNGVFDADRGTAFDAWRHWRDDPGPGGMIAAAVLAASPHNTQPWLFRASGPQISVWADADRVMPSVDPYRREQRTGLGCAVENLVQAPAARGYDAVVTLRPDPADPLLAARVDLRRALVAASDLYDAIGERHSNRGPDTDAAVPDRTLTRLTAVVSDLAPARLRWITDADARGRLGDLLIEAAEAVVADDAMSRDGFAWFRGDADAFWVRQTRGARRTPFPAPPGRRGQPALGPHRKRPHRNDRRKTMTDGPAWYAPKRWMYRGGRPRRLARAMNTFSAWLYAHGWLTSGRGAVLEVRGRRTGKTVSLPVVIADHEGSRYLVSMLGADANWVRNVVAAEGRAVLIRHGAHPVRLVDVPVEQRAPILRRYLEVAPGARPHIAVARTAPLSDFARVAGRYPVFRIEQADR